MSKKCAEKASGSGDPSSGMDIRALVTWLRAGAIWFLVALVPVLAQLLCGLGIHHLGEWAVVPLTTISTAVTIVFGLLVLSAMFWCVALMFTALFEGLRALFEELTMVPKDGGSTPEESSEITSPAATSDDLFNALDLENRFKG